jgi:dipeptidyl aminopeptidase/acylaminoacyl peptidase
VLILAILAVGLTLAVVSTASGRQQRTGTQPQWILFTADPTGLGVEQIFRVTPSGKGLEQLTKGPDSSEAPAFSPNGKRIAFTRLGAGIFSMNLDGTGLRRLTSNGRDNSPTWSPDGKQIAFLRPAVDGWKLYVMSARGAGERRLRLAPSAGRPSWTAQGLVIPTQGDLAKVDPRTGRVQKLFGARIDATEGMDTTSVSPDLSTLTYVGSRPPDPGDKGCGEGVPCAVFGLYVENLSKHQRPRILARNTGPATFSPDGKSLAFVAQNHRILLRVLATGKSKFIPTGKRITPTTTSAPAWQPH